MSSLLSMRCLGAFLLLVCVFDLHQGVAASYPVCTGKACLADPGQLGYCCPGSSINVGGSAATSSCSSQPNCATPAYLAVWSNPTCSGNTPVQAVQVSSSTGASSCMGANSFGNNVYWAVNCGTSSQSLWKLYMWSSQSSCNSNSASPLLSMTQSSVALDTACYSVNGGYSVSLICPYVVDNELDDGTPLYQSSSTSFHTQDLITSTVKTFFGNLAFATWSDASCSYGTAAMFSASQGTCKSVYQYGLNQASYQITCSGNQSTSAWTASQWVGSNCNGNPLGTISGNGRTCATLPNGASITVDCTRLLQYASVNYLPPVDGYLSDWSACSAACGAQGTQTRSCVGPFYGGAPCPSSSVLSQTCTGTCTPIGSSSSSSGGGGGGGHGGNTVASSTGSINPGPGSYGASVVFFLTFNEAAPDASFISTVQSNVASMAGVAPEQVQVKVITSTLTSLRHLLATTSQLQVTILASSTSAAQTAFGQFSTAFTSSNTATNPLVNQSVNNSAPPATQYFVVCADGSTQPSSAQCGVNNAAASLTANAN